MGLPHDICPDAELSLHKLPEFYTPDVFSGSCSIVRIRYDLSMINARTIIMLMTSHLEGCAGMALR